MSARATTALLLAIAAPAAAAVGARPPDFTLRSVPGTAWKGTFRLADHVGRKVVVLSFFATWCRPCEVELPALERVRARFDGRPLVLASIASDGPETAAQIGPTARRLELAFPVLHDADSSITSRYDPRRALPYLVVIDRTGKIVHEKEGWSPADETSLVARLDALVAK